MRIHVWACMESSHKKAMRSEGMRTRSVISKLMHPSSMRGLIIMMSLVRVPSIMALRALLGWEDGMPMTMPAAEAGRDVRALAMALKLGGRGGSAMSMRGE